MILGNLNLQEGHKMSIVNHIFTYVWHFNVLVVLRLYIDISSPAHINIHTHTHIYIYIYIYDIEIGKGKYVTLTHIKQPFIHMTNLG